MGPEPRLTIELVPATCWGSNVREVVSRRQWEVIGAAVRDASGERCEICGGRGQRHPVDCHEVWFYDDIARRQRLVRMCALCPACHGVKHLGRSRQLGFGGDAARHLQEVNGWDAELTAQYIAEAFALWRERSRHEWTQDLSSLADYLPDFRVRAAGSEGHAK